MTFAMLMLAPAAYAGQWKFTLAGSGTNSFTGPYADPKNNPPVWTPPPPSYGSVTTSYSSAGGQGPSAASSVTLAFTVTIQWIPNTGQTLLTEPPPANICLIEQPSATGFMAEAGNTPPPNGIETADDGFQDTPQLHPAQSNPVVITYSLVSAVAHATVLPVPANGVILVDHSGPITQAGPHMIKATTTGAICSGTSSSLSYTVTIAPSLQGPSTVDTAQWPAVLPRFFSGTNCTVSGTAQAYNAPPGNAAYPAGSVYVKSAMLYLGGTLVKSYYDTSAAGHPVAGPFVTLGTNQASAPLSVVFDSTHFADSSAIGAELSVTDSGGLTYSVPLVAPADNELLAVANQTSSWVDYKITPYKNVAESAVDGDLSNGQPYQGVENQSTPNNINGTKIDTDHKNDLINQISQSARSVFFAATHTGQGVLGDCFSTTTSDATTYLFDADIQGAVAIRNAAFSAPYLFVYLHGCDGGGSPHLTNDFGIASTSSNDTSCVAYPATIVVNQQNTNFAVETWHYLVNGKTLDYATSQAFVDNPIQVYRGQLIPPDNNHVIFPAIYGDKNMTLHGTVYNWTSGPAWYR